MNRDGRLWVGFFIAVILGISGVWKIIREQARSHRGSRVITDFVSTREPLWERACSRWRRHWRYKNLMTQLPHLGMRHHF
ncbi:hypothetical protein C2E19_01930 [Pseudomonas sp. DTU12.3]|nr:hypothetical protein C2E19_01930 [Pseudomonas sp. DTU12.3]